MIRTWIAMLGRKVGEWVMGLWEGFKEWMTRRRYVGRYPRFKRFLLVSFLVMVDAFVFSVLWLFIPKYESHFSFENTVVAKEITTDTEEPILDEKPDIRPIEDLVEYIFLKESSRGKNNYSKCEAVGKHNRYGFGIPGNGSYLCFDGDDDRKAAEGWVIQRRAEGLSDKELLCRYNQGRKGGNDTENCAYTSDFE